MFYLCLVAPITYATAAVTPDDEARRVWNTLSQVLSQVLNLCSIRACCKSISEERPACCSACARRPSLVARCPQTLAEAQEYIGSTIRKCFDDPPATAGWCIGVVTAVEPDEGQPDLLRYYIQYENGDEEKLNWDAMMQHLQGPGQHNRSSKPPAAAGGHRKRAAAAVPQVVDDEDSNDNTSLAPVRVAKKQRPSASDHTAADEPVPQYEQQEEEEEKEGGGSKFRKHGTAGHLKKIRLINFMCHANFEMDFAAHVTFISGTAGSGKSAVLQGLQCALGASAKGTGRGSKMEDLVRTGADKAHVKVTLWNIGEDAFQPETYGRWLTIERGFTRRGASDWKVLDERGKKVGDKKDLVVRILDHLSISAVNPLAIMTQETSRTFLGGSSTDGDKYRLFMEATLLQTFRDKLNECEEHVETHKQLKDKLRADYDLLVAERDKYHTALDQLQKVDVLQEQAQQYNNGAAWLAVNLARECLLTAEAHLEVMILSTEAVLNKLLQVKAQELQAVESEVRVLEARVEDITRQMDSLAKEAQQSHAAITAAKLRRATAAKRKQELDTKVAQLEEELQVITATQVEAGDAAAKEYARAKAQLDAQMAKAEEGRAATEAELQRLQQEETGLREELQQASNRDKAARNKVNACNHTLQSLNQEHHELHNNQQSRIFMFGGRPMSQLKQEVERNKRHFSREPIGPLGMHLSLTDTKWGVAAQVVLGGVLRNWLVHNLQDQQLLNQLMTKVGMGHNRPTIWRGSFDRTAYNPARIPRPEGGNWVVLRDVVRVEHPQFAHIIDNKLMDTVHYEIPVLDMNEQRARSVAEVTQMAAGRRMTRGIDVNGYSFTRKGQGAVEAGRALHMRVQLGATVPEQLVQLQQAIHKQQEEAERLQQQLQDIGTDVQQKQHEVDRVHKALRAAHQRRTQAEKNIRDLTMHLGDLIPPHQGSGTAADIADLQATLQASQLEVQDARTVLEEATMAERHVCEENQGKSQDTRRLLEEGQELKEQLDAKDAERQQLAGAKQHIEAQLAGQAQRRVDVQAEKAKYEAGLQQALAAAQAICDEEQGQNAVHWARAEVLQKAHARLDKRTKTKPFVPALLLENAEKLSKQLAAAQQEAGGDKDFIEGQLREAQHQVDVARGSLKAVQKIGIKVKLQYGRRESAYKEQRQTHSIGCSSRFQMYMAKRGHLGVMLVEPDSKTLMLLVKMNVTKDPNAKQVNDLKQLSGGERSTTTVAFFLALGGYTESPFRIMDEYDVFMDAVNRRHATQALLEYALDAPHLQVVLLTPQDMQTVEAAKQQLAKRKEVPEGFVRVVAMRPARQNATQADY